MNAIYTSYEKLSSLDSSRPAGLPALKYHAMDENYFRFFWDGCDFFYEWHTKVPGIPVLTLGWKCGDLPKEAFGSRLARKCIVDIEQLTDESLDVLQGYHQLLADRQEKDDDIHSLHSIVAAQKLHPVNKNARQSGGPVGENAKGEKLGS